jgi:hypothetical protein
MSEDRKKPGVAFWATVTLVVMLVGYPLSWGPLVWIDSRWGVPEWTQGFFEVYSAPLNWAGERSETVPDLYLWYTNFWRSDEPRIH